MASRRDPVRSRLLLAAWVAAAFALSAVRDLRLLLACAALAMLLLRRGLGPALVRTLRSVVPIAALLSLLSLLWLRALGGAWPPLAPFAALALRPVLIGFLGFAVLARVDLFGALEPFPALSRLLSLTLAQIHALRLLATESWQGLQSRMPRRPGPLDVVRSAGGVTAALFTLSTRNARDVADAMRSRGF